MKNMSTHHMNNTKKKKNPPAGTEGGRAVIRTTAEMPAHEILIRVSGFLHQNPEAGGRNSAVTVNSSNMSPLHTEAAP